MNSSYSFLKVRFHPILLLVFLFIALVLMGSGWYSRTARTSPERRLASLTVDFGNGKVRAFEGEAVPNMTIGEAIARAAEAGNMKVAQKVLASVTSLVIEDRADDSSQKQWVAYQSGLQLNADFAQTLIGPGDVILLRFEEHE